MTQPIHRWWLRPDRFEWFSDYLDDRGLQPLVRLTAAGGTVLFGAVAAAMSFSPSGPRSPWQQSVSVAVVVTASLLVVIWAYGWPTRFRSRLYFVGANACVAAACIAQSDRLAGLTGCYTFVVLGAYAALMHCAKSTALNVLIAVAVGAVLAWRAAEQTGDVVLPACEFAVLAVLSVAVPLGLNAMLGVMSRDILRSDRDALTGLLNRRGLRREARRLMARRARDGGCLGVTMIDLDDFKGLNDRRGHGVGDAALVEVGRTLRDRAGPAAVVARIGGEAFVIVDVYGDGAGPPGEEIRGAIAMVPQGVTASVGSASAALPAGTAGHPALLEELIAAADHAMYAAKRAGGNRHRRWV